VTRQLSFDQDGWEDFEWWLDNDPKVARKIRDLIQEILRHPFTGTGKPEPLKRMRRPNIWSRRISKEHRLVYEVHAGEILILQARFHY